MTRQPGWLPARLPMGMHDDDVLVSFVSMLEVVAETVQESIDQLALLAEPAVTPVRMLDVLARMSGSSDLETLPEPERRAWVRAAGPLVLRRGTADHLRALVAPFCSGQVSVTDDGGVFRHGEAPPSRHVVRVRVEGLRHTTSEDLARLVRDAVPAHCTVEIEEVPA